ncbi:MAG: CHAD domain-containing protein [Gemmatimonadaceae bacterium]|nr:CHAD domain-containing protein [Gemmatimonadaceae bacterium]
MTELSVLPADEVRRLLPDACQRPAPEGARLVARHYLQQLLEARAGWAASLTPVADGPNGDPATVDRTALLHAARVALRRLRATLREHERVLDGVADRRTLRALRALSRATSAQRDRDVQLAWLDAQGDALTPAARVEARTLRTRLARAVGPNGQRVEAAFARSLDPIVDTLLARLDRYDLPHRVGHDPAPVTFARQLSTRLTRGVSRLRRDLAHVRSVADQDAMHAVRIRLKRQRALLAPFAKTRPALGAWFDCATRGQDVIGALRDAHLLAERARRAKLEVLARALDDVVLGHYVAFRHDWIDGMETTFSHAERAAAVLRAEGTPATAAGVPMEIERKYLLRSCPAEARAVAPDRIEQGWIPGTMLRERLRRRTAPDGTVQCWRTVKLGPAEARIEVEETTSRELFDAMWPLTASARVRKVRHVVPWGAHHWEIDVFLDRELVLAEVELASLDEPVVLPPWLAACVEREVTGDPAYFNAVLARPDPAAHA